MNRRNAVTLTEVLIAIFVLSIGLMALLSLFPIGAAQMAQALKDQRTAEAAGIAGPPGRILWKEACKFLAPNKGATEPTFQDKNAEAFDKRLKPASEQRFIYAMDDPNLNNLYKDPVTGIFPYKLPDIVPTTIKSYQVRPAYPAMPSLTNGIPNKSTEQVISSYPVFVDPIGWDANATTGALSRMLWVGHPAVGNPIAQPVNGGSLVGLIPRRPLYVQNPGSNAAIAPYVALGRTDPNNLVLRSTQRILSRFSLLDDLGFNVDGTPDRDGRPDTFLHEDKDKASPNYEPLGTVRRDGRYSWSYLFRRQNNVAKNRSNVEMTVVVYSGRSVDVPSPEEQYLAVGNGRQLVINMNDPQHLSPVRKPKPAVRRGSWVLDATIFNIDGTPQPQGYFYRVTNVDDSDPTLIKFDLQQDLAFPNVLNRVIVVMENVVEVFPKGIITSTSPPGDPTP